MRTLNFHHLHYFWTVAKEGHLTRAAQKLNVSQSALSSQIKQLEGQLGHDLFHRQGRALLLTDVGHLVLEYAESIFNLGSELLSVMESGEQHRVQQLRVGAVATLSRNFQENFLRPVIGQNNVTLALKSSNFDDLLEQLRVHKLDLVLSNRPVSLRLHYPLALQTNRAARCLPCRPQYQRVERPALPTRFGQNQSDLARPRERDPHSI